MDQIPLIPQSTHVHQYTRSDKNLEICYIFIYIVRTQQALFVQPCCLVLFRAWLLYTLASFLRTHKKRVSASTPLQEEDNREPSLTLGGEGGGGRGGGGGVRPWARPQEKTRLNQHNCPDVFNVSGREPTKSVTAMRGIDSPVFVCGVLTYVLRALTCPLPGTSPTISAAQPCFGDINATLYQKERK